MGSAKPLSVGYCEIWLSTKNGKYRVSAQVPEKAEVPNDFLCETNEQERICVSPWFRTITEARDRAVLLQTQLRQLGYRILFYFEVRLTRVGDLHTSN